MQVLDQGLVAGGDEGSEELITDCGQGWPDYLDRPGVVDLFQYLGFDSEQIWDASPFQPGAGLYLCDLQARRQVKLWIVKP